MSRSNTRIINLNRVTALNDGDVIPTGPQSGDVSVGITFANLVTLLNINDDPVITEISGDYTIEVTDDYVVATAAPLTATLPLLSLATGPVWISNSGGGVSTIGGNGETVPNGTSLPDSSVRGFLPATAGWIEL